MKIFDIDWADFLPFAVAWEQFSTPARDRALFLGPQQACDVSEFGSELDELVEAGFLETFKDGSRVRATAAYQEALKVLRLMERNPLFLEPTEEVLLGYVRDVFTAEERGALIQMDGWLALAHLPDILGDPAYLNEFLSSKHLEEWESVRLMGLRGDSASSNDQPVLTAPKEAKDLRKLLDVLAAAPGPVPLVELTGRLGRISRRRVWDGVWAGLRYALCFAGFDRDLRPALGLHPAVLERLQRPPAPAPPVVQPEHSVRFAPGVEDTTQFVIFCSEPRRVRANDRQLFAKAERELGALLRPLPDWLEQEGAMHHRLRLARSTAQDLGLVKVIGQGGSTLRIETTAEGRSWLALPVEQRARLVLEGQRFGVDGDESVDYFPLSIADGSIMESLLASAFGELEGPVLLDDFLRYQCETVNPLIKSQVEDRRSHFHNGKPKSVAMLEEVWQFSLMECLNGTLISLGGVQLGQLEGKETIELTDAGRYLLGLTEEFHWPEEEGGSAILIQPDFEIIFLDENPALEAELTRFAERIGQGVGALFRLTAASVQSAARAGLEVGDILGTLERASQTEIPSNVAREIEEWHAQAVHLAWESVLLIRCPDEASAARVLSAARGKLEALSPRVLALKDNKQRTQVTNACRKAGVFLDPPPDAPKKKTRRRRSRRWNW